MTDAPTFARPRFGWFVVLDGGIAALAALALSESAHQAAAESLPLPGRDRLRLLLVATVGVHVGEALVARRMARHRGLPSGRWARQTFAVGFPSLLAMRRLDGRA